MKSENLPFAVSNQDQGVTTPQGFTNAGEAIVEKLTSAEGSASEAPIAWTQVDSAQELDAAMEDNEYYGALIIPDGFTASQAAAKLGSGEAILLVVELDNAKSPLVANSLRTQVGQPFASSGQDVQVTVLH